MDKLQRPAKMERLHELLEFIDAGAIASGFSDNARNRIRLAAEEALVNVILHAYPGAEGPVEVSWTKTEGPALTIEIRDGGVRFDPLAVKDPDTEADLEDRKIGGLGIFFMREVADAMSYRRESENNVLILIFRER